MVNHRIRRFVRDAIFPIADWATRLWRKAANWYEGGFPLLQGDTSYTPQIVQDARFDQNYITRREMLRLMRFQEENNGIFEAILSVGETYTVGPTGLPVCWHPTDAPNSENSDDDDDPWFDAAEVVTEEWFQSCGWNGESMAQILQIAYRRQKTDGDVLIIPTNKRGQLDIGKGRIISLPKPSLQLIEGHRIESPFEDWTNEGITRMDGVEFRIVTVNDRPLMQRVGYWTRAGFGEFETESSWSLIPVEMCWYLRNQQRANQPRAVSDFYSVAKDFIRLNDMLDMEMRAQNSQSNMAVFVENASGQANTFDPKLRALQSFRGQPQQPGQTNDSLKNLSQFYKEAYGGLWMFGKPGEKPNVMAPNRPSDATLNLFELLIGKICAGTKMPRCLVMQKISGQSSKSQGTEVRAELDNADNYFRKDSVKWQQFVVGASLFFMEWAIKNDPRVADPPDNWRTCCHVSQPAACNVDVERNANADALQLASGQTNYHLLYSPRGLSARKELRRLAREQKQIEKWGLKLTLPALLPGQIPLDGKDDKKPVAQEA